MKHACVSCGKPGGDPRNGGLCPSCQVFTRPRSLGRRTYLLPMLAERKGT